MTSRAARDLEYLYALSRHGIRPGLERIEALLAALGNPEAAYPSIHIAGTNGKGSTAAMAASVLVEAGYRTGLYTSPHLERFNERIGVSGRLITDPEIASLASAVRSASRRMRGKGPITFFEFTTAMAFAHFRAKRVDIAVIETGMGGRFDATNTVVPEVSVITNIGLDHAEYLGNDTLKVASEKAGIIKAGRPVVTCETKRGPLSVIKAAAKARGARLYALNRDFRADVSKGSIGYSGLKAGLKGLSLGLKGPHQAANAAGALAALELLRERGFSIPASAIRRGLKAVQWPGRFEVLSRRPLVILDGAHNPAGAAALGDALGAARQGRLILVIGVMADKDVEGLLRLLAPEASLVIAASPALERAMDAGRLAALARRHSPALAERSVKAACRLALSLASAKDTVCITGSLFTVGEARGCLKRALG